MPKTNLLPKTGHPVRMKRLPKGPNHGIQLLLIQAVEHLGQQGDVVEVKPGYARNYLLPQGLATIATDHHKRMVEKHKALLMQLEKERQSKLHTLAAELAKKSITIEANVNEEGHLYGSVGANEIIAVLKQENVTLNAGQIKLTGPLKEVGLYTVKLALGHGVEGEIKVWVVPTVGDGVLPTKPTEARQA